MESKVNDMEYIINNLNCYILFLFGVHLTLWGVLLCSKKKMIHRNIIFQGFILTNFLVMPVRDLVKSDLGILEIFIYTSTILFIILLTRKYAYLRYTILNMDYKAFKYEFIEKTKYFDSTNFNKVFKKSSNNSISVNLYDYKSKSLYHEIITEINVILSNHKKKYLSKMSIINLVLGLFCITYAIVMIKI